jgi:ABC-type multidrug transport system ATPase subunit
MPLKETYTITPSLQRKYASVSVETCCFAQKVLILVQSKRAFANVSFLIDDLHFPTLTVEQTIKFAARMRAPRDRLGSSREEYVNDMTNTLLSLFGLDEVRHTLVGDAAVRGVSGGQKKRVSICEVLATRPRLVSWDK